VSVGTAAGSSPATTTAGDNSRGRGGCFACRAPLRTKRERAAVRGSVRKEEGIGRRRFVGDMRRKGQIGTLTVAPSAGPEDNNNKEACRRLPRGLARSG
jgi:hypothetical protein